jgi:hypothetical protein
MTQQIDYLDTKDEEKAIYEILKNDSITSKNVSIVSIILSGFALISSFTAVYYANKDDKADTIWQKEQIQELKKVNSNLEKQILFADSLIRINKVLISNSTQKTHFKNQK